MSTPPITGATDAEKLTSSATSTTRNTGGTLGKDDFLKLLVGQMKNMDPLGAGNSDPSQSMAQMTQYSILEQLTNLGTANKQAAAVGLIGKNVTYTGSDGKPLTGTVDSVETVGEKTTLTIGGKGGISPSAVIQVS